MIRHKFSIALLLIVLLAAVLRFYNLSGNPVSLYWDEVASTYNAYSIAQSGRDEYGTPHPLLFKSFSDYKTPANIYITSVAVKLFGLNEFSARFTSAFLGTLSVLVSFFLVVEFFYKQKIVDKEIDPRLIALITTFLFSISPWHIQFSRTGFEANVGLFFVLLAVYLFLKFVNLTSFRYFYLSMSTFALSIYFYRSIWVFAPFLILILVFVYRDVLKRNFKQTILGFIIFFLILLPFLPWALSKDGFTRQRQVNVFTNSDELVYQAAVKQNEAGNTSLAKTIYNRRVVYTETIVRNYFAHFGPKFLFLEGDGNPRHGVFGMGLLYLWEAPFLLIGIYILLKLKSDLRNLIIAWILIAPIPSALSVPSPHALRSLNILPIPQLLAALGIIFVLYSLRKTYRKLFIAFLSLVITIFLVRYLYFYYKVTPNTSSSYWADGYKQLTQYVFGNEDKYDKVVISGHWWQPYIYFLFYKKYDPHLFQKYGSKSSFDKYIFGGTSWDMKGRELGDQDLVKLSRTNNILIAFSPVEYELQKNKVNKISEVRNHNNEIVFIMASLR